MLRPVCFFLTGRGSWASDSYWGWDTWLSGAGGSSSCDAHPIPGFGMRAAFRSQVERTQW
ncbi:hypothetical protein KVA01_16980 [Kocuria varians]|uniref:Uncharacterized protein n=1 Tax=Kocuria varians TaxID=1272 RepID=A0A4Y4D7G0_KOCVA|nr:hypothetical protein KVA01_16980 [Kocuria varians]